MSLCEKFPYLKFFWSVFSRIRTEYGLREFVWIFAIILLQNLE